MAIFKNFKCPNGNPPEDCYHVPQLIINISQYFLKKKRINPSEVPKAGSSQIKNLRRKG